LSRNFIQKDPPSRKYDRVGITTLFTFYWDITIETINFAKQLCKDENGVMIGGVLASILPDKVEEATGIRPHVGTLDTPGELDDGNDMIIDMLPLDYSILEEIDYTYPANNAYFAYMTRGCINKCKFCAVPKLEPIYKEFLPVSEQVRVAEERYGAKRDLLLLDNNVLASCRYSDIIEDIKSAGFASDSTYLEPNKYEIETVQTHIQLYVIVAVTESMFQTQYMMTTLLSVKAAMMTIIIVVIALCMMMKYHGIVKRITAILQLNVNM